MMEEWQRRQRAEKERERQQKQASAEYLSGYRGQLNEDDVKLQALKEEERRKKAEAAQSLHNFKKLEEPNAKLTSPVRTAAMFPTPVNAGGAQQQQDDIAFGSVSALKANLESSQTTSPVKSSDTPKAAGVTAEMPTTSGGSSMPPTMEPLDWNTNPTTEEAPAPTETPTTLAADPFTAAAAASGAEESSAPPPPTQPTATPAEPGSFLAATQPTTTPAPPSPPKPLTVYFKFGIITDVAPAQDASLLESYTNAIRSILNHTAATNNNNVGTLQSVTVQEKELDASFQDEHQRPGVYRLMVTVAVVWQPPVGQGIEKSDRAAIRTTVWNAVGQAIQSGQLLEQSRLFK